MQFGDVVAALKVLHGRIGDAIHVMELLEDGLPAVAPAADETPAPERKTKRAKRETNGAARETKPAKAEIAADAEETSAQIVVRTLRESGGPLTGAELGNALEEAGRCKRSVYAVLKTLVEADLIGRVTHNGIYKWALKKGV